MGFLFQVLIANLNFISHAAVPCPPRSLIVTAGKALISNVAMYDEIKPESAGSYASRIGLSEAQVNSRYGASGVFVCETAWGNGQVVGKRNTVVTVFHTFLKDKESCDKPRDLKRCGFLYKNGSKLETVYVGRIIAHAECKPGEKIDEDWAIVELRKDVSKTVTPYAIPSSTALKPGQALTLVGRTSAFNPDNIKGDLIAYPQAFASCTAMVKDTFKYWKEYQSNCPSAPGGSGSALLIEDKRPTFGGLLTGDMTTKEICVPQVNPNSEDGPFERNCRGSLILPVEGKFLDALRAIK